MYDDYLVVKNSLKNDVEDGKVTGFSFGIRLSNYRGNFLSLFHAFYVNVDGVDYLRGTQYMEVNGKAPRSMDEIAKACWEHWDMQDTAYLHIKKEGGLEPGMHTVQYRQYSLDAYGFGPTDELYVKNPPEPGKAVQSGFGGKTERINSYELELKEA